MQARWVVPVGVVLLALALTVLVGRGSSEQAEAPVPAPAPAPDPTVSASAVADLVLFEGDGFRIGYPRGWRELSSEDPQVALVAAGGDGGSLLLRVSEPGFEVVATEDVTEAQRYTDQLVAGGRGVQLLAQPTRIELAGLPGWYYFYTFEDESTGDRGVHGHYFVFSETSMFSIVFQALPTDRFVDLAPTFDAVAASFRVEDGGSAE